MKITEITVTTSGLYEWGRGFLSRRQAEGWASFWESYDGIFWRVSVESDGSVFLSEVYGGGMIHPMDFTLVLQKDLPENRSTLEELHRALAKLAKDLKFTFRILVRELLVPDGQTDCALFSTEKGIEEALPGRIGVPEADKPAEAAPASGLPSIGPSPYRADIVWHSDGRVLAEVGRRFGSVDSAFKAILRKARELKHRTTGHSRHWVTARHEHIVDYGSHSFYGRITSNGKEK